MSHARKEKKRQKDKKTKKKKTKRRKIPEEVVSVVPCKEVALRRVVPQAEISHLNRQYGHLCPLFNNDKK